MCGEKLGGGGLFKTSALGIRKALQLERLGSPYVCSDIHLFIQRPCVERLLFVLEAVVKKIPSCLELNQPINIYHTPTVC